MPLCLNLVTQARSVDPSSISAHCVLNVIAWLLRDLFSFLSFRSWKTFCCGSVAELCLTLQPLGLQHARLLCPLLRFMSIESVMLSNHLTLSLPFCLHSFAASGSLPGSQLLASGDQSIGASATVLLVNIQGWFPLGLTGMILQSKGLT